MKRILTLILASVLLLGIVCSCGGNTGNGGNGGGKDVIQTDGDYKMPDVNMNGAEVKVLNPDEFAKMKIDFVVPESADDTLDIAIYESNMRAQEQFNFTLVEDEFAGTGWDTTYIDMANHFIKNVNSGDDVYDFIHFPVNQRMELMTNGYIMDLSELEGFQLDKPWWDANINDVININGRQYMVSGSISLMPYESMTCIFFNKDILNDNALDSPYEMVKDGSWTLDALIELGQGAMNLNSDSNWWVLEGGTSVAGIGRHRDYPMFFLKSAGIDFVTEADGDYEFSLESDDFYAAVEKIQVLFKGCTSGGIGTGDASNTANHYLKLFSTNRCLFAMGELKAGVELRDSEVDFGLLPMPKLRAEQENYITTDIERLHFICIPSTSEDPENVAKILDAMAYDRYKNVVPVYYDSYVTYKGLRDEESLDMLEIMTETRTIDVGIAYGWCNELLTKVSHEITGDGIASMIAAEKNSVNETIDDFVENYLN